MFNSFKKIIILIVVVYLIAGSLP